MTDAGFKQVKVDNWGVFFLQRLHQFFSKSEFCDLILLFKNAERIKVHRIVLYACTEYFQVLEKNSPPGSTHLLQMPEDMDPEVVVPIINFMYTGRLEFRSELHSRLYSTAKLMSMTVLTKLLDAQSNALSVQGSLKAISTKRNQVPCHTLWNVPTKKVPVKQADLGLPEPLPGRKLPIWKRRNNLPVGNPHINDSTPAILASAHFLSKNGANSRLEDVAGPMRFDWPDVDLKPQTYNPSFDDITYESKSLVKPADTAKTIVSQSTSHCLTSVPAGITNSFKKEMQRTASFEEVRRTAVAVKRPSYGDSAGASPEKQPKVVDLQAVKEYVQEHQLRKGLVEVEDGSEEVDDDLAVADFDDDDDDAEGDEDGNQSQDTGSVVKIPVTTALPQPAKSILKTQVSQDGAASSNANTPTASPSPKRVRFSLGGSAESSEGKENEAKVDTNVVAATSPSHSANSSVGSQSPPEENLANHAKIITEVLKKYPHLVKNKKNIKLKILQRGQDASSSCTNSVDGKGIKSKVSYVVLKPDVVSKGKQTASGVVLKHGNKVEPLSELPSSVLAAAASGRPGGTATVSSKIPLVVSQPVASGAENTTGPWLCYSCGHDGNPVNFESYYLYRRHLQDVHMEKIDARICEHCGHRASKRNLLLYHLYTRHNVPPPRNCQFPRCDQCEYVALSESLLIKHRNNHSNNSEFVCKVCNATFKSNGALQGHIQANLHSDPAKKNYECPICRKPFVRNINLKAHLRTAHGDVTRKVEKEEPGHGIVSRKNEGSNNRMVPVQQSKAGTVVLPPGVTVLAHGPTGPVQTLVPSSEAEALSNVASGIAASLGLSTGTLNGEQTVIVLDDTQEYILGSAGDTEVQDYVEEAMVQTDNQEYIVPEIMSGEEVHPYESAVVTTASGESFSTIVQTPALNQTVVPPPIHVSESGNTDGIGLVISDHDYANEVALRGMPGEGMMFIIAQPGPDGNTILQTGHITAESQQQHAEVYAQQLTQQLQHQFVHQQQFQEQKSNQQSLQQQQIIHQQIMQQNQKEATQQQLKLEQQFPQLQQNQAHHQQQQPAKQPKDNKQQLLKNKDCHPKETLQHQQQMLQEQVLQHQREKQSVSRKQQVHASSDLQQQLISGTAYIVQQNSLSQEINNIITNENARTTNVGVTNANIISHQSNSVVPHTEICVRQTTQDADGVLEHVTVSTEPVTVEAECVTIVQSTASDVGTNHVDMSVSDSRRLETSDIALGTDISTSIAQQVSVYGTECSSNSVIQQEDQVSEEELVMADMQAVVPDAADGSYSTSGHIAMADVNEARRMASDLVKDWDEFDDDSCEFAESQLVQKNKDSGNNDACVS